MEIFKNWAKNKEALLEGLSESKRNIVGQLMENQKTHILNETANASSTQASNVGQFQNIVIPMIRRVIPGTIATEIVGVQPMSGPVGLAFSMRFEYAEALGTGGVADISAGDEVFGINSKTKSFYSGGMTAGTDGNFFSSDDVATGNGADTSLFEAFGGRKLRMSVLRQTVTATSRKLQAVWTPEAMQDLDKQHGLNLESEITNALSADIVSEINHEIITDLITLAGTTESYDMNSTAFTGTPNYVGDRHAVLGILVAKVANEIARLTRKGPGNFAVVSPQIATVLQSASRSVFAPAVQGSFDAPDGTRLIGTLNGSIKVYSYVYFDQGTEPIVIGYKGSSELDAGYFYCPYIPLTQSGVVVNPSTYEQQTMISTRYGKASFTSTSTSLGNSSSYYGKINVANLKFI